MYLRQSAIKNRDTKYALAKYLALHHTDKVGDLDVFDYKVLQTCLEMSENVRKCLENVPLTCCRISF